MPILENIQLGCAVCRIVLYNIYKRIFCIKDAAPRPIFRPVCIGLDDAGKSTLLALLAGESTEDIQPTKGFLIKAIQFNDCILNVKEIGGGEKVRPFWKHYYQGADAVIFVVNSACSDDVMIEASDALSEVLEHPALRGLPLLVVANCQDRNGARNESQLKEDLDMEIEGFRDRDVTIILSSKNDVTSLRNPFAEFNTKYLVNKIDEQDTTNAKDASSFNRI